MGKVKIIILDISNKSGVSGFIRIFGYGLSWKNMKRTKLLFSERNGYGKSFKIGNYYFSVLTPA